MEKKEILSKAFHVTILVFTLSILINKLRFFSFLIINKKNTQLITHLCSYRQAIVSRVNLMDVSQFVVSNDDQNN